jgi:hypothetical protein
MTFVKSTANISSFLVRVVQRDRVGLYVSYEGGRFRPDGDTSKGPKQEVRLKLGEAKVVDERGRSFVTLENDERWYYDGMKKIRKPDPGLTLEETRRAVSEERHPHLTALLHDGVVRVDKEEFVGRAADGTDVSVGTTYDPDGAERYLAARPEPKDW